MEIRVSVIVFSATLNNILAISWWLVLLAEDTRVPGENRRPVVSKVIVWLLDLQLPAQSMPITTNVVSSNPAHGEVYSIQHHVLKFLPC
jgi:hypothetical protein